MGPTFAFLLDKCHPFSLLISISRAFLNYSQLPSCFPSDIRQISKPPSKFQMSPLLISQIPPTPLTKPPTLRGIFVNSLNFNSSPRRREHLRCLLPEGDIWPAAAGRRAVVVAGVVSCAAKAFMAEEAFVKKTVASHDIVIFSKSYCPYCARAKSVFKEMDKDTFVVELDERDDGQDIQDAMGKLVGRQTVPQVFIKGEHLGGSDDTVAAYRSGKLAELLAA